MLTIRPVKGSGWISITARDRTVEVQGLLARPRGFTVPELPFKGRVQGAG